MKCELSIIVPVFNASNYIERTIKALVTQEIEHYEIIIVDDGSTDDTPLICDKISTSYHNIHCHHIENSGPGQARNFGVKQALGKYIAFCDSDDIPSPNMYGILLSDLKRHNVEYALCDIFSERDNRAFGFPWPGNNKFEGKEDVIQKLMASMLGNLSDNDKAQPVWGSSVRCIYLRDVIIKNNILFPTDIRFAEDLVFNIRYISKINSCHIRNEALYRYTCNPESLMNSHVNYNNTAFNQRIKLVELISEEIAKLPDHKMLYKRFMTSQRCYFLEMIGNAARAIPVKGSSYALAEIRDIVNHPLVISAYQHFDAKSLKKRLSYLLVKWRLARVLLYYYRHRIGN